MEHVFLLLAFLIVLFWAVGMATGAAAMILYLGLEETYFLAPVRRLAEQADRVLMHVKEVSVGTATSAWLQLKRVSRWEFLLLRKHVP